MMRVVCIGECMIELRAADATPDTFARSYAGDAYNTAVYLKRTLPDARVQFMTATGDDGLSSAMRDAWRAQGVDDELAFLVPGGTPGLYLIETESTGERRFRYWRKDSAARHWLPLLLAKGESHLWGADLVYLSGISLAILNPEHRAEALTLLRRLKGRVGRIAFDPNVRVALWEDLAVAQATMEFAFEAADTVLPSTEDLTLLFGIDAPEAQLDRLESSRHLDEIALTLGSGGCIVSDRRARVRLPPPLAPVVLDTSGAGDSFNGAYLGVRLQGGTAKRAAEYGMSIAARVVSQRGAIVPASTSHP